MGRAKVFQVRSLYVLHVSSRMRFINPCAQMLRLNSLSYLASDAIYQFRIRMLGERSVKVWGLVLLGLLFTPPALAQFELDRLVIANGGGQSESSEWTLSGTVGQSDAHVVPLCSDDGSTPGECAGASFELVGGFWAGLKTARPLSCAEVADCIFRNGFEAAP